jgi:phosphoribosylpyrophosphate synthetase
MNFLALDDLLVTQEGEMVDPLSVIEVPHHDGFPLFPEFEHSRSDPFIQAVNVSGKKWVIVTDTQGEPSLVLNANDFLREVFFAETAVKVRHFCHHPVVVRDTRTQLGNVLSRLMATGSRNDDVIENGLVLVWAEQRRVITGSDILGRLLRGITPRHSKLTFS